MIDLVDSRVEVYRQPDRAAAHYRLQDRYLAGNSVAFVIAGRKHGRLAVTDLLP